MPLSLSDRGRNGGFTCAAAIGRLTTLCAQRPVRGKLAVAGGRGGGIAGGRQSSASGAGDSWWIIHLMHGCPGRKHGVGVQGFGSFIPRGGYRIPSQLMRSSAAGSLVALM